MEADETRPGATYHVAWNDCCTTGSFTSQLVSKIYSDEDPDFLSSMIFSNGVTLETPLWGVHFKELAK